MPSECNKLGEYVCVSMEIYVRMHEPRCVCDFGMDVKYFCPYSVSINTCCAHAQTQTHSHCIDLWFFDWQNSHTKQNLRNYWYLIALIWSKICSHKRINSQNFESRIRNEEKEKKYVSTMNILFFVNVFLNFFRALSLKMSHFVKVQMRFFSSSSL